MLSHLNSSPCLFCSSSTSKTHTHTNNDIAKHSKAKLQSNGLAFFSPTYESLIRFTVACNSQYSQYFLHTPMGNLSCLSLQVEGKCRIHFVTNSTVCGCLQSVLMHHYCMHGATWVQMGLTFVLHMINTCFQAVPGCVYQNTFPLRFEMNGARCI